MAGKNCFSCRHSAFIEAVNDGCGFYEPASLFCLRKKEDIWNDESDESLESTSRNVARACDLFEEAD